MGDAILAAALLAKGLRKNFRQMAHNLTPCCLDKFKDKNAAVVRNIHLAIGNFLAYCYTLEEATEPLQAALNHKTPKVNSAF